MNVLSLFDGISCGQLALQYAEIAYCNYFASEIDKYAIKVTQHNFPDTIQVGDICHLKARQLPIIDLLIGGSPCQGFSFAGKQLAFNDPRSKLFFEYVRLLDACKPKYFLLENVVMKKEYQNIISKYLGVEPIMINSALVSAQNRRRLYWTNIPNIQQPIDKHIYLKDICIDNSGVIARQVGRKIINGKRADKANIKAVQRLEFNFNGKSNALTTVLKDNLVLLNWTVTRNLQPIECERLQTIPDNYTAMVSNSQRYKLLGNAWTVDVIAHIFNNLSYK